MRKQRSWNDDDGDYDDDGNNDDYDDNDDSV